MITLSGQVVSRVAQLHRRWCRLAPRLAVQGYLSLPTPQNSSFHLRPQWFGRLLPAACFGNATVAATHCEPAALTCIYKPWLAPRVSQ